MLLVPRGLRSVGKAACILQGPLLLGVVGTPWLLQLMLCWLECTWSCWLVVSSALLPQVFLLRLLALHLWVLLLPSLLFTADLGRCCLVCPCRLWTCTSTPQMLHSFHHILVASASVCVLRQLLLLLLHLLPLVFLCHGLLPSSPVEGPPHSSKLGSSPLFLSSRVICCWTYFLLPVVVLIVFCCIGLLPKCSLLLFVGAHLDASRITAPLPWKDSRQPVASAVAVCAFSAVLLDPGSRPSCCTECTDAQLTCWERVLSYNIYRGY